MASLLHKYNEEEQQKGICFFFRVKEIWILIPNKRMKS